MGAHEYQHTSTSVKEITGKAEDNNKVPVYPNPFMAYTFITFRLLNPGKIAVKISDINARYIFTLMDANIPKDEYTMTWEGTDDHRNAVPTGAYIANFIHNGRKIAEKKIVKR